VSTGNPTDERANAPSVARFAFRLLAVFPIFGHFSLAVFPKNARFLLAVFPIFGYFLLAVFPKMDERRALC